MLIPYQQLSEEQKGVIRDISRETGNLFVEGPPGSGKTLISLYTLRDMVRETSIRPLLMMYNHSLFGYLSSALKELGIQDNLTIVTKDKFFWDKAANHGIRPPDFNANYDEKYSYLLNQLKNQTLAKDYDVTVVDEVQDLKLEEWELIKRMSKKVLTLGDFNQGVYTSNISRDSVSSYGIFKALTKIFRFHKNIAKFARQFSKNNEDLEAKVAKDSKVQPKLIDTNGIQEYEKIAEILTEIKGFRKRIGVICPDNSELKLLSIYLLNNGVEYNFYPSNKDLRTHDFSSTIPLLISSFSSKGLEFEHVILFGFNENSSMITKLRAENKLKDVIYVSITRTNSNLYIVRTNNTIQELKNLTVQEDVSITNISLDDIF